MSNIYATPESELTFEQHTQTDVASRWARVGAAFLDAMMALVIVMGGVFLIFGFDVMLTGGGDNPTLYLLSFVGLGMLSYIILHGYTLAKTGQTLGKKAVGIKVVTLAGEKPSFARLVFIRYMLVQVFQAIPVVGSFFALINVLLIFGSQKRCGHDRVAGTKVVYCQS